jgi:lysyl-tRNA synthetase class 2
MNEINTLDQHAVRRAKLEEIRHIRNAYPSGLAPNVVASILFERYQQFDKAALENITLNTYQLAGRIMQMRHMGKAAFLHIQDSSGKIQVYLRKQDLPEALFEESKSWDLGDIIFIEGHVFKTQKGELSLYAKNGQLLTKSLHPLPDKYHGLSDKEACYRMRYLDLMVNPETQKRFRIRSKIIQTIRQTLLDENFLEVETPMMHTLAGGASAKPFLTHHNTLDIPLFMRIAPELHLKRLVVGGFDRVFEINRNFRNEGISTRHNPEFTMLEFYQAYATYETLMAFTEKMLAHVTFTATGAYEVVYQDHTINMQGPYEKLSMSQAIAKYSQHSEDKLTTLVDLQHIATQENISLDPSWDYGQCLLALFEALAEEKLIQPTFITGYPRSVSPLARSQDDHPELTDRFEFFIAGQEIANGFSELNDPDDQRQRFEAQVKAKQSGDDEAMPYDHDYVKALEYGMAPTAGEGIGIDRLTMILTNSPTIRDVILFPTLRPKAESL